MLLKRKTSAETLKLQEKYGVPYLVFPSLENTGLVRHAFSTRLGGCSTGDLATMNLSSTRGDDPENVKTMLDIILLNTRGKHPELVSPELIELLKYMERSTDEVSGECKSKRIQEMHRRVCQIKASEKTEVKYMQTWEEQIMIKQEGITEGRIEGEKIGRLRGKRELLEKLSDKFSIEQISEMLEIDISELKNIMKEIQNEKYL